MLPLDTVWVVEREGRKVSYRHRSGSEEFMLQLVYVCAMVPLDTVWVVER
jgi:hypothetical protein